MVISQPCSLSQFFHKLFFFSLFIFCLAFSANPGTSATVDLAWDPPSDTSQVAGYNVYCGPSGSDYTAEPDLTVSDPAQTSCSLSGLTEGSEYVFAATSYDDSGTESDFSNSITHTVPVSDTDGDGLTDAEETGTYGTDPNAADTDGDGIDDLAEVDYWGDNWNADIDGDGLINILDADSDGDGVSDGTELAENSDPADPSDQFGDFRIAFDDIVVNHQWTTIELPSGFIDPVIVAGPLTLNGDDPAVVRIRNITATSFEIRLQEFCYLDDVHTIETVSYLAMERGYFQLDDGTLVEAGRLDSSACDSSFDTASFDNGFAQAPVVMTSLNSDNDATAVATRIRSISNTGFEVQMQEQEGSDQAHASETIGFIAWQPGSGTSNSVMYEAGLTGNEVTHEPFDLQYSSSPFTTPVVLAAQQTRDGGDTANLRLANKTRAEARILVDEEQSGDSEVSHTTEQAGYLCLLATDIDLTADTDSDGLSNGDEIEDYGTDPYVPDTDQDGLADGEETTLWGSDWSADVDGDGLINLLDPDADNDGVQDGEEVAQGSDPSDANSFPQKDSDGDGLTDLDETGTYGTDPQNADTDGDGLGDGQEINVYGTDPNAADSDSDGLNDGDEAAYWGSSWNGDIDGDDLINILDADSDGDGVSDGDELDQGSDPSDPSDQSNLPVMAFDLVAVNHEWSTVELPSGFTDPVIVAGPLSLNGDDPAVVRIRNITVESFEIRLQEYEYLDGSHTVETVSYLAMDKGSYELEDGTVVEAGRVSSSAMDSSFESVAFSGSFTQTPVVMASLNSYNDAAAAGIRVDNTSTGGFDVQMEEQEGSDQVHSSETIGYIAWEPCSGSFDGVMFEAGLTPDQVADEPYTVQFSSNLPTSPVFLAWQQTRDGGDTANLRLGSLSQTQAQIHVDEEQSGDSEVNHTTEQAGYLCLVKVDLDPAGDEDADGLTNGEELNTFGTDPYAQDSDSDGLQDQEEVEYWSADWSSDPDFDGLVNLLDPDSDNDGFLDGAEVLHGFDPAYDTSKPSDPIMEHGTLHIDHTWTQVQLDKEFVNPVVVCGPLSLSDADPAVVRVRNVTGTGFEIRVQEFDYQDGQHVQEVVSYLVMEKGSYTLSDGNVVEAGLFETGSTSFATQALSAGFSTAPVVMASVTTANESDAVLGRIRNVTASGFDYCLQEEEGNSQSHALETIGYIAWEPSFGSVNGLAYQVGVTANEVTDAFTSVPYTQTFGSIPALLGAQQTCDGANTANIRVDNSASTGFDVQVDEEQSNDSEVGHITEVVGFMAFDLH